MTSGLPDPLTRLQYWYAQQCNDDWEHVFGVKIEALGEPGWALEIDLSNTVFGEVEFPDFTRQSPHDGRVWLTLKSEGETVTGYCGMLCLAHLIDVAITAIESYGQSLETFQTNGFWDHRRVP